MPTCLVGLGSNLGARIAILEQAISRLDADPAVGVVARSRWFPTRPIGGPAGQGEFVNAALRVETALPPDAFHARLRAVEAALGRQRRERWAARVIDLDLLLYGDWVWNRPELTIPHPRMAFRRFVLEPAAEVAGDLRHPAIGWTVQQLLDHLNSATPYVAVTGVPGTGKTELAQAVAKTRSLRLLRDEQARIAAARPAMGRTAASVAAEVACLQRRAAQLDAGAFSAPAISDFWIGQSLAYGRVQAGGPVPVELETAWREAAARVVPPKLLAVLTPPGDETPLVRAFRDVIAETRPGPVLWLDAADRPWALTELQAAIEAMTG